MSKALDLIKEERERQIAKEGYTAEHDDSLRTGELANFACCYAFDAWIAGFEEERLFQILNPFRGGLKLNREGEACRPHSIDSRIRDLVIAGSLIAAEIDKLLRLKDSGKKLLLPGLKEGSRIIK